MYWTLFRKQTILRSRRGILEPSELHDFESRPSIAPRDGTAAARGVVCISDDFFREHAFRKRLSRAFRYREMFNARQFQFSAKYVFEAQFW